MKLNNIKILFLLTSFVGVNFATEISERKEVDLSRINIANERVIIPSQYKTLEMNKNRIKRLAEKIEQTKAYQFLDKYIIKNADKFLIQVSKEIMVAGLIGMQMFFSTYNVGPVVYTSQMEAGRGFTQYGISKKINPKLLIMVLLGFSFLVNWLCTFDTYAEVNVEPSDFDNSTVTYNDNGRTTDPASAYNDVLNNCLIDLYDALGGNVPTLTSNYSLGAYNNAVNECLDNINTVINGQPNPLNSPWLFLTDFQYTFLIAVYLTGVYILQDLGKSKRTIKSQTDTNCMQIQVDASLNEEQIDDINFDNNTSGKLIFDRTKKSVDVGCMATETENSTIITTQNDSDSSTSSSPNVTPEKDKRKIAYQGIVKSPNVNVSTQTKQKGRVSLFDYACMSEDQEDTEVVMPNQISFASVDPVHFAIDID